jgi:hypothetical protein
VGIEVAVIKKLLSGEWPALEMNIISLSEEEG